MRNENIQTVYMPKRIVDQLRLLGVIKHGEIKCLDCDQRFVPWDARQKFCCDTCSARFYKWKTRHAAVNASASVQLS